MKIEELINKHYNQLNETDLHILKYILNNKSECHKLGINSLAEKCNVSRSSILRLAQKLGFSGYSEFRVFLKWQEQEGGNSDKSQVEILRNDILETLKYIKKKDFSEICKLIHHAQRIFIYGTGTAQLDCAFELQRMFLAVQKYLHVIQAQTELEMVIKDLTINDLVIIIWFITKSCTCTCHESMLAVSSRTRNAKRWIFLYPYPRRFISLILLFVPSIFPFE